MDSSIIYRAEASRSRCQECGRQVANGNGCMFSEFGEAVNGRFHDRYNQLMSNLPILLCSVFVSCPYLYITLASCLI